MRLCGRALIEAELDFADKADIPGSVSDEVWTDIAELWEQIEGISRDITVPRSSGMASTW